MPELPEVESFRRKISSVVVGRKIQRISFNSEHKGIDRDGLRRLRGSRLVSVRRRGKYLLLDADGDRSLIAHLGMSGRFVFRRAQTTHDKFTIEFEGGECLTFSDYRRFGRVWVRYAPVDHDPALRKLGPEPLSDEFQADCLKVDSRRPVKAVLLDQGVVAGIGNIYACESLYWANIHPQRPMNSLKAKERNALAASIRDVIARSIDAGGATLDDYRGTEGETGNFERQFAVYGRSASCPRCKGGCEVAKIRLAGRITYLCVRLQR